jgi:hypothetical protein
MGYEALLTVEVLKVSFCFSQMNADETQILAGYFNAAIHTLRNSR